MIISRSICLDISIRLGESARYTLVRKIAIFPDGKAFLSLLSGKPAIFPDGKHLE